MLRAALNALRESTNPFLSFYQSETHRRRLAADKALAATEADVAAWLAARDSKVRRAALEEVEPVITAAIRWSDGEVCCQGGTKEHTAGCPWQKIEGELFDAIYPVRERRLAGEVKP